MQLKSILNRVQKHKSFVYEEVEWGRDGERATLRVSIRPRAHTRPVCSGCKRARPGYDTLPVRDFEFVPLWGIAVFFVYALRRVNCSCGVKVEAVRWATGKHSLTTDAFPGARWPGSFTPRGKRSFTRWSGWCSGVWSTAD